jgi:hypothetical protein
MKKLLLSASIVFLMFSCQNDDTNSDSINVAAIEISAKRSCATQDMLELQLKNDPTLAKKMQEMELKNASIMATGKIVNGVLEIPVVFNVLYSTAAENVSVAQLQSQIDVLNADFQGTNSDYNSSNPYNNVRGALNVKFYLDQVIRKATTRTVWYSEDEFMKNATTGIAATSPTTKLNYWVVSNLRSKSNNSQLLGYGKFPGTTTAALDGIVCGNYCTGTTGLAAAPYNLGRTATHEVGHWMNLRHIWGDANCGSDLVTDTPSHDSPNYGLPAVGLRSTCSGTPLEMYMNYMDYTDDKGMYMFSSGQVSRMAAIFSSSGSRASFR